MERQLLGYTDWPYEVDSAPYNQSQMFGQEGQFPSAMVQEPSAFVNNAFVPPQQLHFPALGGDYRQPGQEVSEQAYSGNWCQVIVPDYTGQVLGVSMAPQAPGRSPLVAKPMEQPNGPEMRSAHDFGMFAAEQKMQPQLPGHLLPPTSTSAMHHGVYYPQWNPSYNMSGATPTPAASSTMSTCSIVPTQSVPPPTQKRRGGQREAPYSRKTKGGSAAPAPASARTPSTYNRRSSHGARGNPEVENISMEELEAFAKLLKQKRVALGFTQADLGIALGKLYGRVFSQTTICRFEALQLSFGNMCALLPVLKRWLAEVEASDNPHELHKVQRVVVNVAKRKNRTSLSDETRQSLEDWYSVCPRPTAQQITQLAISLELHRDVVRVWFCNRRQKGKRLVKNSTEEQNQHLAFQYIQCHPQMPQYNEHDQQGLHMQVMTLPAQGYPGSGHPTVPAMYVPPPQSTEAYNQVLPHGLHHFRD